MDREDDTDWDYEEMRAEARNAEELDSIIEGIHDRVYLLWISFLVSLVLMALFWITGLLGF